MPNGATVHLFSHQGKKQYFKPVHAVVTAAPYLREVEVTFCSNNKLCLVVEGGLNGYITQFIFWLATSWPYQLMGVCCRLKLIFFLHYLFCHLRHCEGILATIELHFFPVISSAPQVSVTEYNKLQAEIHQLRSDLQVSKMRLAQFFFNYPFST